MFAKGYKFTIIKLCKSNQQKRHARRVMQRLTDMSFNFSYANFSSINLLITDTGGTHQIPFQVSEYHHVPESDP